MSLYTIIRDLIRSSGRSSVELPRGLWLVHYAAERRDQPERLVAGRYLSRPSDQELAIVRDTLLDVLDGIETRVAYDITPWAETDNGDWHGFVFSWRATAVTDAFSSDPERAELIRLALEQREQRIEERRKREAKKKSRSTPADPKPML